MNSFVLLNRALRRGKLDCSVETAAKYEGGLWYASTVEIVACALAVAAAVAGLVLTVLRAPSAGALFLVAVICWMARSWERSAKSTVLFILEPRSRRAR